MDSTSVQDNIGDVSQADSLEPGELPPSTVSGLSGNALQRAPPLTPAEAFDKAEAPRTSTPRRTLRLRQRSAVAIEARAIRRENARKKKKRSFKCSVCNIACNSRKALNDHFGSRRHKNQLDFKKNGPFKCEQCHREFDARVHLRIHLKSRDHLRVVTALEIARPGH